MLTDNPDVEALMVDPIAAVIIAEVRDAGIITIVQAERAWGMIAFKKGLLTTASTRFRRHNLKAANVRRLNAGHCGWRLDCSRHI